MAARAAKTAVTGKKPTPPTEGPLATRQVNLTDEDSCIMPVAGDGFEQCYNVQAALAADSLLVIAAGVVQAPNDKQKLEPMLDRIADLSGALGKVGELLADNGFFSEANVNACAAAGIDPVIAMGREAHHPSLDERFAKPGHRPEEKLRTYLATPGTLALFENGAEAARATNQIARLVACEKPIGQESALSDREGWAERADRSPSFTHRPRESASPP